MPLQKRPDGFYLDGRKINVGDTIEEIDPSSAELGRPDWDSTWSPIVITAEFLSRRFDPHTNNEDSLDAILHMKRKVRWPPKA